MFVEKNVIYREKKNNSLAQAFETGIVVALDNEQTSTDSHTIRDVSSRHLLCDLTSRGDRDRNRSYVTWHRIFSALVMEKPIVGIFEHEVQAKPRGQ